MKIRKKMGALAPPHKEHPPLNQGPCVGVSADRVTPMKKSDVELTLELCKFLAISKENLTKLINQEADYPHILGQLLYNRVGGAAYYVLLKSELLGKLNREFRNSLKTVYETNILKNNSFQKVLDDISEVMNNANFNYAVLKGGYLSQIYPPGIRTSNDIDILVNQQDITRITEVFLKNGYQHGYIRNNKFIPATRAEIISSRMNRGETIPLVKKVDLPFMEYSEVDINFSLDYKAKQENDAVEKMLASCEKLIKDKLYTLSCLDFFIHLCIHLYKEAAIYSWVQMGRDLSLYKFLDIYLLTNSFDAECIKFLSQRIIELGFQKECYYAAYFTKIIYDIKNTNLEAFLENIKPGSTNYMDEMYDPQTGKRYKHKLGMPERLFSPNRRNDIYEVSEITV